MNELLVESLNNYMDIDHPDYAMLLTGNWGAGKSHFIQKYIELLKANETKEIKVVDVSLFGLKNVSDIDDKVFQELNPILGSKYTKFAGNLFKSLVSFGFKFDFDNDGKDDVSSNVDIKDVDFFKFLSKEPGRELVFFFDDLERTGVPLEDFLGYINLLTEKSGFKVVVAANEKEIIDKDSEGYYCSNKEKVFGRTVVIRNDFNDVLDSFLERKESVLSRAKEDIEWVYYKSGYDNLRHVKRTIDDFICFEKYISSHYLENDGFLSVFVRNFFSLSLECMRDVAYDFGKHYSKYQVELLGYTWNPIWESMIRNHSIDEDHTNELISNLPFFREEPGSELWRRLTDYRELDENEFNLSIDDLISRLESVEFDSINSYLQAVSWLIYFSRNKVVDKTDEDIAEVVDRLVLSGLLEDKWVGGYKSAIPLGGYKSGFVSSSDELFKDIYEKVVRCFNQVLSRRIEEDDEDEIRSFLSSIESNDIDEIRNILLARYEHKPFLNRVSPETFFDVLMKSGNKTISFISSSIEHRFSQYHTLNGQEYYLFLLDELEFWEEVTKNVQKYLNDDKKDGLRVFILSEFNEHRLMPLVTLLSQVNSTDN